jgi:hypothetical protein
MERDQEKTGKNKLFVALIIALVILLIVLLILFSPLKEMLFPPAAKPEITLLVIESTGPDSATGLYRIVVEAQVKGNPEPQVTFSRNDGVAEMAINQALILLEETDTFLLRALATNPQGSTEAEIELFAGIATGSSGRASSSEITAGGDPTPDSDEDEADPDLDGDTASDDEDEPDEPVENTPEAPQIAEILIVIGSDLIDLLRIPGESFPMRYEETVHRFMVNVECDAGEELDLQVEATDGEVDGVGPGVLVDDAPENLRPFIFTWRSPANPAGNLAALNVSIAVSACSPSEECDTEIIRLALLPEPEDRPELTASYSPVATLTGQVNEDGPVFKSSESSGVPSFYVGDLATNKKVKGFVSFDISELAGKNIIGASLNMLSGAVGNPSAYSGNLRISSTNYGSSLDSADYSAPANSIRSFRPGFSDLSFSNNQLRDYIQSVAATGATYAQFVLDYSGITNNGTADGRSILIQDVSLEIIYN